MMRKILPLLLRGKTTGVFSRAMSSSRDALQGKYGHLERYLVESSVNSLVFDFSSATEAQKPASSILLTCEHGGNSLPKGVEWSKEELESGLNKSHWAYDPGAAELSLELGQKVGCKVVVSRLSRLFVDVNRSLTSDTLFRRDCDGHLVSFNKGLESGEEMERLRTFYLPYYASLKSAFHQVRPDFLFSLHSFTRFYQGEEREVEAGVLFSFRKHLAERTLEKLGQTVFREEREGKLRFNEPWSGQKGLMHAVDSLFSSSASSSTPMKEVESCMIEFRNDRLTDEEWRRNLIDSCLVPLILSLPSNSKL